MSRALKTKPDPEAEGRQQDLERFTAFRMENDLPFDRKHLPAWWENLPDLENRYWRSEQKEAAVKAAIPPARPRKAPVYVTLRAYAKDMEAVGRVLKQVIDPMKARLDALEAKPSMQHRGVWRADTQYQQGDVVSHGGSGWISKALNKAQKPGETRLWTLFVKKGRDAR